MFIWFYVDYVDEVDIPIYDYVEQEDDGDALTEDEEDAAGESLGGPC